MPAKCRNLPPGYYAVQAIVEYDPSQGAKAYRVKWKGLLSTFGLVIGVVVIHSSRTKAERLRKVETGRVHSVCGWMFLVSLFFPRSSFNQIFKRERANAFCVYMWTRYLYIDIDIYISIYMYFISIDIYRNI